MPTESHPGLLGRSAELADLADVVRRLSALTVTTAADAALLRRAVAELETVAGALTETLPPVPFPRFAVPEGDGQVAGDDLAAMAATPTAMPFDMVIGRYNPLAPPVTVEHDLTSEPPRAVGLVTFGTLHEGAPGCVHGGVMVGVFDIVLTVANRLAGVSGPTTRLSFRFRRPTLVGVECRFEGWVVERDERRVTSHGRLIQNGKVTMEAEGRFAIFTPEEVRALGRRLERPD